MYDVQPADANQQASPNCCMSAPQNKIYNHLKNALQNLILQNYTWLIQIILFIKKIEHNPSTSLI